VGIVWYPRGVSALRRREWVALALLAFSALVAITFIDATAGPDIAPRTPVLGEPPPRPTNTPGPEPTPTATPLPHHISETDRSWAVQFFNEGSDEAVRVAINDTLDIHYEITPFDLHHGRWQLEATTTPILEQGEHILTIEYTGSVTITVDGNEVATGQPTTEPRTLSAAFHHPGGRATITIYASHSADPFHLRIK
jgi:hypothetical protein